ncbi:hypothetical protein WJ47_02750 [Burkholderia ubonensis]|uniref:Uncharacterized protein n=1 Tax=Burkholderia ubonensis TaxID=101571 RepID=A0AB73FUT9_9BURK|nr:hypothetical protein [Burkholderia ubonensis]KVK88733.1 hypothetical protein WJ44_29300 [Burkholderia ubonensis]KVL72709.1 hypothetical protein WJ47_02750 [Burkholderia ubonensis]KVM23338.1 hypothetical protein WJ53_17820 [Burkholderia ubonensis]KVM29636.1 hypothetical protein WJ54_11755 [Burkholderia ubonensis]
MTTATQRHQELLGQIDAIALAIRAVIAVLPEQQSRRLTGEIAERAEKYLLRPEPVNETEPYILTFNQLIAVMLQRGPEVSIHGAEEIPHAQR